MLQTLKLILSACHCQEVKQGHYFNHKCLKLNHCSSLNLSFILVNPLDSILASILKALCVFHLPQVVSFHENENPSTLNSIVNPPALLLLSFVS